MAKPAPAEDAAALRRRLRRSLAAVAAGGAAADVYDEAAAALEALREAELGTGGRKGGGDGEGRRLAAEGGEENGAVPVPPQFLCPISSRIMSDPVIVASGQTYDRRSIEEWFSAGKQLCPQTQQALLDTTLIPNHLIRSMILQWCTENRFNLPQVEHQEENDVTDSDQRTFDEIFKRITSSQKSTEMRQAIKDLRLITKQNSNFRAVLGERPDSISQMIFARSTPGLQNDPQVLEDMVTIILNFSLHDSNKKVIGDDPEAIPFLIWALKSGDMGSRGNSAAAIFTLSALDSNKEKIGELGAMGPLVDLLDNGNIIAKKDAASAIFNLCLLHENKSRATKNGIVDVAMRAIDDHLLVDGSLAILALLSSNHEVVEMITEFDGIACMLRAIRESECSRSKENAVVVLFAICMFNRTKLKEVEADEKVNGSLALLAQSGTSRARRKAVGILEKMKRNMHNRHSSC
ncbi:U-box domain-containing protein 9-like [Panicum miliaceum]|uniref:RING-type E3 ubiquitin transferase n=1 Tax=Panicum miliaceum TaxID=4540 RepID=A0A3L6QAN8_PANMI|nr:U-box domain-containing protein 9-like [Panicum miliaceum]